MTFNSRGPQPNRGQQGNQNRERENAIQIYNELIFKPQWISQEADKDMIDYAERSGRFMAQNGLTNSKIRSIYGEIKRIQMGDFKNEKVSFYLLKPKVAYALGRDPKNEGLILFKKIFDKCFSCVTDDSKTYLNFCNFLEAILAYHKAFGGKD
jgi:CRISPR-associated protein Csm2